jgi:molybdate transport system substrate-binding protein
VKKVCSFIIIIVLALSLAGSGCAEKEAYSPASGSSEKEFSGRQITVCSGAGLIKPMTELIGNFETLTLLI